MCIYIYICAKILAYSEIVRCRPTRMLASSSQASSCLRLSSSSATWGFPKKGDPNIVKGFRALGFWGFRAIKSRDPYLKDPKIR